MAMTPPAAASLLHRILLPGAAAGPLFRLAPRSPASVSVALLPRRRRWRGPVQLQSLPPEGDARASQEVRLKLMEEDSKFVPLNAEDIQAFLKELEGEFLKVIHCTEDMTKQALWDAMHTEQPNLEAVKIAESLPRVWIFSGLTGEEMMMFINAFPETAAFAALVPNSAEKVLGEVIEEITDDHEMLEAGRGDSFQGRAAVVEP